MQQTMWDALYALLSSKVSNIFYAPFEYIYVHGPKWLGMWEGLPPKDICTGLTYVSSDAWSHMQADCVSLIRRHTHATVIGIALLASLIGIHACCNACALRTILAEQNNKCLQTKPGSPPN